MKVGSRLGSYEVLERLGAGGMGEVWLARDAKLGRKVALKTLPERFASDRARRRRFEQEARTVAALNHPNIVTLYSVEQEDETCFLAMEYVEGRTLDALIPEGGQPPEAFFAVALPMTEAVAAAHRQGIAHRDLKPRNIMVTEDARVKVLDFGLARHFDSDATDGTSPSTLETRTQAGQVLGTVPYMSPEQLGGAVADQGSDLFSLGVVFHEMLTGSRPFRGASFAALASSILRDPAPALGDVRPGVPARLAALVDRCLQKDPARRHASADELLRELSAARHEFAEGRIAAPAARKTESASTVAVADFVNIAGDAEIDWLSTGVAETVTVDLKKLAALAVVSREKVIRTSSEIAETKARDDLALGQRLGVDSLICGGFQRVGPALRITAQVIDVASGEVTGSFKVDGTVAGIFELQDRLVAGLTAALRVDMGAGEASRTTVHPPASTGKLEAFECYARARWHVGRMNVADFGEARRLLARAVEIDPDYPLAQAELGRLCAMTYIATTNADDLSAAIQHLTRATELDAELADAYPWLSYVLMRAEQFEEAVTAGRRGVQLDPTSSISHYMLGVAMWVQAVREYRADNWPGVYRHLAESARLTPRYQAAHQLLGAAWIFRGRYDQARTALQAAAEIEASDDYELARFVGSHLVLGRLCFREGRLDEALRLARRSLEILEQRDHVYTPAMVALTHGLVGDVLFRRRRFEEAVTEYRMAVEGAMAHPRSLGIGAILVRARLGLARCFRGLRMKREALLLFEEATDLFRRRKGYDFSWTIEVTDGDLYFELALYHAVAGQDDEALGALRKAVECGWADPHPLEDDPVFERLRPRRELAEILRLATDAE